MPKPPRAVPDVRELPCPARPGDAPHEIRVGRPGPGRAQSNPASYCLSCGATWAELDEAIR